MVSGRGTTRGARRLVLAGAAMLAFSACGGSGLAANSQPITQPTSVATPAGPMSVAVDPPNGASGVRLDHTVIVQATNGLITAIQVTEAGSDTAVPGVLSTDGRRWTSHSGLDSNATYTVKTTVGGAGGAHLDSSSTFSTISVQRLTSAAVPGDGDVVGIGMPIKIRFNTDIPDAQKPGIVAHLQVTSSPAQVGGWHWFSDNEVHYRPENFWTPGSTVHLTAALQGVDAGNGYWGLGSWDETFTIGDAHISYIDNNTLRMQVTSNGQQLYDWPVSMGRDHRWPTISGTLVVWGKVQDILMDSLGLGIPRNSPDGYYEHVYWDTAISTDGFYVHSAPWSVGQQGFVNVSHGCVNLSPERAITFFNFSRRGDVVIIKNTLRVADAGDGEGDWQTPFSQWVPGGQEVGMPGSTSTTPIRTG